MLVQSTVVGALTAERDSGCVCVYWCDHNKRNSFSAHGCLNHQRVEICIFMRNDHMECSGWGWGDGNEYLTSPAAAVHNTGQARLPKQTTGQEKESSDHHPGENCELECMRFGRMVMATRRTQHHRIWSYALGHGGF